jgi:cytochrome c oxidase subunit 2
MAARRSHRVRLRLLAGLLAALLLLALAGCATRDFPQSSFNPHSDYAGWIQSLNLQLLFWVAVILVTVEVLLVVAVIRFRSRPGAPEPKAVHGNTALEIAWTLAPALILTFVAIPTVVTIFRSQQAPPRVGLVAKVVGHQWWWEFQYPTLGITTADELHVPLGRTVVLEIESADVVHSFWVPAMGGKRDAIPNHTNRLWFTPSTAGTYPGQCTEFCGTSHANMRLKLIVETPAEFAAWVARQQAPPAGGGAAPESVAAAAAAVPTLSPLAAEGKQVFGQSACIACHTIAGVSAGTIGPNLTHFASRTSFAGATLERTPENLRRWLADPPGQKPGALMPNLGLTPAQIRALVAYLQSLN